MKQKTVEQVIGTSSLPRKISERVVGDLLNFSLSQLILRKDSASLSSTQYRKFKKIEKKIEDGEPLQHATGEADFYGLKFKVDKSVLIPRPETEILVKEAKEFIKLKVHKVYKEKTNLNIVDVGTGSGCISIALAKELKPVIHNSQFIIHYSACDISSAALKVAHTNAKIHKAEIEFFKSDLLSNPKLPERFDLVLANLPYLSEDYFKKYPKKLADHLRHEPDLALNGGAEGLQLIKKLISELPDRLAKNGLAILEIDPSQKNPVEEISKKFGLKSEFILDLNRRIRFVKITIPNF